MGSKFEIPILGFDEVGRGCLAGPVIVACVLGNLKSINSKPKNIVIRDSKKMTSLQRKQANLWIVQNFAFGIGQTSSNLIDKIGINSATKLAAARAFKNFRTVFSIHDDFQIINDGRELWFEEGSALIKGDSKIIEISLASIVAKVYRDNLMIKIGSKYPDWGFERHVGYGTEWHCKQIKKYGLIKKIHRSKFCKNLATEV